MDPIYEVSRNDPALAAKQRMDSFRLGKDKPATANRPNSFHGRSHSKNSSLSSANSRSSVSGLSLSSSTNIFSDMPHLPASNSLPLAPKSRPNSHHRRRSSVSTRRESAELMGVSIPDLPVTTSEDNINLGEKDSIRRRALWALEGKPDMVSNKIEIPDLSTPEIEKTSFDFSNTAKPSFSSGFGSKRDSFKLLGPSASNKDQLHTLVEEEEEEETEVETDDAFISEADDTAVSTPISDDSEPEESTITLVKATPVRQRPATLNLRPLSLTPESLIISPNGLPTPVLTPGSQRSFQLKALSLVPSSKDEVPPVLTRRHSLISNTPTRRPSLSINCESPSPAEEHVRRRSSISYRSSPLTNSTGLQLQGLPTPDGTPILSERRMSSESVSKRTSSESSSSKMEEDFPQHRPLSASEHSFLYRSHHALLARITDLERALSSQNQSHSSQRSRSRPESMLSEVSFSSNSNAEPSDEMLQVIADLKAERDELKRDVDGWRTRVGDLEEKVGVFSKRVEAERRDAWVARQRIGLIEVEKAALERVVEEKSKQAEDAMAKCEELERQCYHLRGVVSELEARVDGAKETEELCERLRVSLDEERRMREALECELEEASSLITPALEEVSTPTAGFLSGNSSLTDVDEVEQLLHKTTEEYDDEEEDDGLAGYEDEEDSDLSFQSPGSSSSLGSMDSFPRSAFQHGDLDDTPTPSTSNSRSPTPSATDNQNTHASRASLSMTWKFPSKGSIPTTPSPLRDLEEVDHFFGCLDNYDSQPNAEIRKHDFFSRGFGASEEDEDEMPPFVLPNDVGVEVEENAASSPLALEAVVEEDEAEDEDEDNDDSYDEDEVFDEEISGIRIIFTPPQPDQEGPSKIVEVASQASASSNSKPAPIFFDSSDEEDDDETVPFNFGRPIAKAPEEMKPSATRVISLPSSIPRYTPSKSFIGGGDVVTSTPPPRFTPMHDSGPVTPPSKRAVPRPSFIPQPVTPPKKVAASPKPKAQPSQPTFIPQPKRSPIIANVKNEREPMNNFSRPTATQAPVRATAVLDDNMAPYPDIPHPSTPLNNHKNSSTSPSNSFASSFMSSPITSRLSFQSISNFIPLSWTSSKTSTPLESPKIPAINAERGPSIGRPVAATEKRVPTFVTKEKQLDRLRNKLDSGKSSRIGRTRDVDACKSCRDDVVSI